MYTKLLVKSYILHIIGYFIMGYLVSDMEVLDQVIFFILFLFIDVNSKEKYQNILMSVAEANNMLGDDE